MKFLTIDDFDFKGKTVFLRVDMNCPIDPDTLEISGTKRIEEIVETINSLNSAKIVIASHQGRVGNKDYTSMEKHAEVLEKMLNRKVTYVNDVMGSAAQNEIKKLNDGEILLLDNLRLCAEENYEFSGSNAAKTIMVRRLSKLLDLCVLDSFPSAHRSHPSIVGFPYVLPACAGRLVEKEVKKLDEIMNVAKAPHVLVLGGKKVEDRLEAIRLLIENGRADHVLLTGLIGNVFLRAQGRIRSTLGIKREDEIVAKAHTLIGEFPDVFSTPVDVAIEQNGKRVELDIRELNKDDEIYDLGPKTIEHYGKIGVKLDMVDGKKHDVKPSEEKKKVTDVKFVPTEEDKEFIRQLQKDMEIVDRPFQKAAKNLGMTEEQIFEKLHHYEEIGVMRRYAAILRHREAGFTANGMIVWKVPEGRITEVGNKLGAFPQVSHCYERPVYPDWPYNVFSMIHCKSFDEAGEVAGQIQKQIDVDEYKILFSAKEFKKTRVEYFVENEFSLEEKITA